MVRVCNLSVIGSFEQCRVKCKSDRAFQVGFGAKVEKSFGLNLGLRRTFCLNLGLRRTYFLPETYFLSQKIIKITWQYC